jgi:ATP-binding cassette subfamily B multidrug efflux pump
MDSSSLEAWYQIMIKLAHYLKHYKKQVIIGPFFKLLEAIFELIVPLVMASIIDVGIKNNDVAYVLNIMPPLHHKV